MSNQRVYLKEMDGIAQSLVKMSQQNFNTGMIDQYLKKKDNFQVIEISSDDQPPRPTQSQKIIKPIISPIEPCKEEQTLTFVRQMKPKQKPNKMVTESPQKQKKRSEVIQVIQNQSNKMILTEVLCHESEDEFNYDYVINCFEQARDINKNLPVQEISQQQKIDVEPIQAEQPIELSLCQANRMQQSPPKSNLPSIILKNWMSYLLAKKQNSCI